MNGTLVPGLCAYLILGCGVRSQANLTPPCRSCCGARKLSGGGLSCGRFPVPPAHFPATGYRVQDCQWLQQLHSYELLRAAFRPEDSICRLRSLQRHRKSLVERGDGRPRKRKPIEAILSWIQKDLSTAACFYNKHRCDFRAQTKPGKRARGWNQSNNKISR